MLCSVTEAQREEFEGEALVALSRHLMELDCVVVMSIGENGPV